MHNLSNSGAIPQNTLKIHSYKKFELMLTRCAKAYSSYGSVV